MMKYYIFIAFQDISSIISYPLKFIYNVEITQKRKNKRNEKRETNNNDKQEKDVT